MKGIDSEPACHCLNVNPRILTRRQKRRSLDLERAQVLKDKVDKLLGRDSFAKQSTRPRFRTLSWSLSRAGYGDAA